VRTGKRPEADLLRNGVPACYDKTRRFSLSEIRYEIIYPSDKEKDGETHGVLDRMVEAVNG